MKPTQTHTPGPWIVGDTRNPNALWIEAAPHKFPGGETSRNVVAKAYDPTLYGSGGEVELRANARLIAAAPELLAALAHIEAKADHAKDNPRIQTDRLFDILELARAAIARATAQP